MNPVLLLIGAITVAGCVLSMLGPLLTGMPPSTPAYITLGEADAELAEADQQRERPRKSAKFVLGSFAAVVGIAGILTFIHYRDVIARNQDSFYFWVWLFLFMVAGMFVQVIASNHRAGRALLDISASQLVFPVLFSVVVFYPIWAIAASASHSFFSIHAAFLNGYFWESVVSTASRPTITKRSE